MIGALRTARTLEELEFIFFNTLYLWRAAYVFLLMISYHRFLVLFTPST
jgi:hypothetical protein